MTGRDNSGKIWLLDVNMNIWRFDPATGQWVWLNGGGSTVPALNWGTKGVEASTNHPGTRNGMGAVWDLTGRLWLYGGSTTISGSVFFFGDLWRYDGATNQWTWMTGTNTSFTSATFGVRNVPSDTNNPGMRTNFIAGLDPQGRLVFFGGGAPNPACDVWRYDPATNRWVWLGGAQGTLITGVYGTKGVPSTSNRIGSRAWGSTLWLPEDGSVWIFGGNGFDGSGDFSLYPMNDLWRFNPASNEWTWINGVSLVGIANMSGHPGLYGTKGVAGATNQPGSRINSTGWLDPQGDLWMMGGTGMDSTASTSGELNDVWKYSRSAGQWTWMAGANLKAQSAVFGTLGTPSAANTPAGVRGGTGARWHDPTGSLRLIGGGGSADIWSFELPAAQEIRVTSGFVDITDGTSFQVTDAPAGGTSQTVLTLTNTGTSALTSLAASLSGTHLAEYSLTGPAVTTLAAGESTTITISFTPTAAGPRTAALSISSNDADENPYDIALSGVYAEPEIAVEQPVGTNLTDGSATVTLPATALGASSAATTFSIRNLGNIELTGIIITKDGTHSSDFTVSTPSTSIAAGASATFTVVFSPMAVGTRTAAIHIASNDADENPFDITLTGTGNGAEIVVEQPVGTDLVDGAATLTFPATNVSNTSTATTVTLRNTGNQTLTGLSITKVGTNPAEFTVGSLASSLAAGASTTFNVSFAPTSGGTRTAELRIASNDFDENPFNIALTGMGNAPEIEVEQPAGTPLTDGASTITLPPASVGYSTTQVTVTILNTGIAPLSSINITKDGSHSGDFSLSSSGASIPAGGSAVFNITFYPQAVGTRTAAIHIASNDSDESPFDLVLTGQGLAPEPGAVDLSFASGISYADASCALPDGKIVIGGNISLIEGTIRNRIARLHANGALDYGFNPSANNVVRALAAQADGKLLVGGDFTQIAGASRSYLARLHADGTLDSGFDAGVAGTVSCISPQADGKIVIAGSFPVVGGATRNRIARLNADGTLDTGFNPNASGDVYALRTMPDGKIYAGGFFTTIGGLSRSYLARLNTDGSADSSFNANVSSYVYDIAALADGKIMIGGVFSSAGGASRSRLAKLNVDGTADPLFTTGTASTSSNYVSSLNQQADGKIIVCGYFTALGAHPRNYIGRLNADGSVDATFNPSASFPLTSSPILLKNGQLLVNGYFPARTGLVRLINDPATETLEVMSTNRVRWLRGGSAPEASGVRFELSIDSGSTWQPLGTGQRISGGWEIQGLILPSSGQIRARARYAVNGTQYNSSAEIETITSYSGALDKPEIVLEQPAGTNLYDGDGSSRDFGSTLVGGSNNLTFTLKNTGNAPLTGISLTKDGANAADFIVSTLPSSIAAQSSVDFTVDFTPSATGARIAAIHIASDDEDENPFDLTLTGTGISPEIVVEYPTGTSLTDGLSNVTLPTTNVGSSSAAQTFTLRNTGTAPLTSISITKDGTNNGEFAVSTPVTSIAVGASATFTVTFSPTGVSGARSAALHIASSDLDESPFDIGLTATANAPEIVVEQPVGTGLVDGVSTLTFPTTNVSSTSAATTVTIRNTGTGPLTGISVSKSGASSAEFNVSTPVTTLAAGASTTFTITFAPTAGGPRTAELLIASNDLDENPFNIAVTGTGNAPEIEIEQPAGTVLVDGVSTVALPSAGVGATGTQSTFTVRNLGIAPLTGISITKDGTNSDEFTVSSPGTSIAPGDSAVFNVMFAPSAVGTRTAAIHVFSNDSNENPFDIALTGQGLTPPPGAVDLSSPDNSAFPYISCVQPDGKILLGGGFTFMLGTPRSRLARLNTNETLDFGFDPGANDSVIALAVQMDGKILVGGSFTQIAGTSRSYLARLNADGTLDGTFDPGVNGDVWSITVQRDGKILIAGGFNAVGGTSRSYLARLNADGSLDGVFNPSPNGEVRVTRLLPDGKIYVGGFFGSIGGLGRPYLARLNSDGTCDPAFNANVNSYVIDIAMLQAGKVMIGGYFSSAGGASRARIARLEVNGSADPAFSIGTGGGFNYVLSLLPQADGKVIVSGEFSSIGAFARSNIGRVNPDNTVDLTFNPNPTYTTNTPVLLKNGQVFISGTFPARSGLVRLVNDPATESLVIDSTSKIRWLRGGSSPEANETSFEFSSNGGASWQPLGYGVRINGGWEINALSLPASGQIRARARYAVGGSQKSSESMAQTVQPYSGAVDKPEIAVEQPVGADLADGSSSNFGSTLLGGTNSLTFTLKNTGNAALTGISLTKDGSNAGDFTVSALPASIAAQSSVTFTVDFAPSALGARTAAIHIASNDEDENPFNLTLTGTGISPEIVVEYPTGTSLTDGVSNVGLPTTSVGSSSAAQTFTVRNTGTSPLTGISITKDGAHSSEFTVSTPVTSIAAGASATFTVTFAPVGSGGTRTAAIHIASSDLDENPFSIGLTATANAPEIEVEQPVGAALVDGVSTVDFGPVLVGSNTVRTFTIRNTGALTLSSLALSKAGTDSANFTLSSLSTTSLAAGGSTTFTVTFAPGATVTRNAIIRVASNDFDENPFDIAVTGSGIAPEIAIEQPAGTNLSDGTSTTAFGNVAVAGSVTQTYTVRNVGTAPLTGLALSKAGTNTADFTLGTLAVTTLNPGENTTFDVTFIPTAIGARSAILRVASNDADENPFDINLAGTGLAAEIAVEQPVGSNLPDGGSRSFGSVLLGTSASLSFTIRNSGNIDLTGLTITKDGTHADDFTLTTSPTAPVSGPSGSTTFTVQFTPSALGTRSAAIHIASNDADENPFDILLSGTGIAPEIVIEYPSGNGLTDGVSTLPLPGTDIGSVSNITVTLRNTGSATLTGIVITKDGDNSAEFGTSTPATSLSAGFSTTFSVSFSPTALGTRTAAIHIASSDADENPFDLVLTGTGTSPEVEIEHPAGVGLVDGISSVDYGTVNVGSTLVKTFTVRNTGTSSLSGLALSKTGTNSTLFTLSSLSTTSLAIGASTTFTVTYAPNAVAAHSAIIRLSSNDLDESPFDIAVTGSGIAPEIAIEAPVGTNLTDNGSTITFPATVAGSSSDPVTFTVRNTGSATLTGLALSKVGTNTADFIVGSLGVASLAPTESTTFTVVFTPTAGGTRSATLRVASNDSDENPFDIALTGTATAPTISIEQPANFALTSGSGIIDFGELPPGSPIGRTFRIRNTGTAPLSNIVLTKSGANPGDFTLGTPGATTIAPGAFTTFSVIFNPTSGGYRNATLNIASNATNVSSFSINVTGAGLGPEIEVTASVPFTTVNMVDGAYQLNMRHAAISPPTPNTHWVTITNNGLLDLTGLAFTFSGPASGEYSASTLTTTTLVPGQSTTFSVYFSPSELGERLATLHILSNDHDESSFEIQLKGTGLTRNLAWSIQYFGFSNYGYDPFLIGEYEDHQDPDRDGTPNLLEFATGQHPLNSTTPAQSFTIGTGGECLYTYQRSKAAVADGLIFAVQHNATLDPAGWSSAGVTETILSDDGTLQTVQATIPAPTGGSCFTRLRVTRP